MSWLEKWLTILMRQESRGKNTLRIIENLDSFWKFTKLPSNSYILTQDYTSLEFEDNSWETINLPHTYNSKDGASGRTGICEGGEHYYRGLACYRKQIFLSSEKYSGKQLYLEFGGANTIAEVYINGFFTGKHEGGYSAFRFNITSLVNFDKENLIVVKVSNSPTDYIAPITDQGDFTKMGGLYRSVRLLSVEQIHVAMEDYGSYGVYVTPRNITSESSLVDVHVKLDKPENISASVTLLDDNGMCAAKKIGRFYNDDSMMLTLKIVSPILWHGIESPHLYTAVVTLYDGEIPCDEVLVSFGIRYYYIDSENGFFLNGKAYKLHGVNYHQDSFENGWAMTDVQRERDYSIIRDMGCTAVRMAHYQHCEKEYSICDRMGICVWSEIGIINKMSPDNGDTPVVSAKFAENAKMQLREMIRQNYNHPSVIVWGISNELYQMSDEIYALYSELYTIAGEEDKTRLKTFADAQFWGRFLELPGDVVGYNRYFGWYKDAGSADKFGEWLDYYHAEKEKRPICISEYGGGGAISQHKDNVDWENEIDPWGERHYENYQSQMHEKIWAQFAERKYLWAQFIWCMFDFASDGRQEGDTKGQNDKGLVTRERIPKDAYFFYKTIWGKEKTVYITERRHNPRPYRVPYVKVYSNAEKVELSVNGVSVGTISKKSLPKNSNTVFLWENIMIEKNRENNILVTAEFDDGCVKFDTVTWIGQ